MAIASLWLAGCGTIANVYTALSPVPDYGPPHGTPYGGAAHDVEVAWDLLVAHERYYDGIPSLFGLMWLMDLPLSLAGDTVTLPVIIAAQVRPSGQRHAAQPDVNSKSASIR